jgi:hypothetical protein
MKVAAMVLCAGRAFVLGSIGVAIDSVEPQEPEPSRSNPRQDAAKATRNSRRAQGQRKSGPRGVPLSIRELPDMPVVEPDRAAVCTGRRATADSFRDKNLK